MKQWVCSICGNDTSNVDYDYLINYDHISCHIGVWGGKDVPTHKDKLKTGFMKIKGWEKISGYTYKGYTIVNPIHNAEETKYEATILNLNLPQKPKWELEVLTPGYKWKLADDYFFDIIIWDENRLNTRTKMDKHAMKSISHFRQTFEQLVDRILSIRLTSAPIYSSQSVGGIVNHVNNSGTTIPYGQMVQSIQSMQQTINNLTQNTPTNPF